MNFHLLITLILNLFLVASADRKSGINWKYISLPNSLLDEHEDTHVNANSSSINLIFSFENYQIKFRPAVIQVHDDLESIDFEYTLYGVDFSNNEISDKALELLFKNNMDLFGAIRYINLSGNRITKWNSNKFIRELLSNLEVLILDNNEALESFNFNLVNLKVLSLASCNLAFATDFERIRLASLIYLGNYYLHVPIWLYGLGV